MTPELHIDEVFPPGSEQRQRLEDMGERLLAIYMVDHGMTHEQASAEVRRAIVQAAAEPVAGEDVGEDVGDIDDGAA